VEGKLPEHMVPAAYMRLERLPLTINGKVDRGALPEPEISLNEDEYEPPAREIEKIFCEIFGQILELDAETVSVTADFFRLGGSSIRAMKLVNRIQRETRTRISVADIFAYKTIRAITENLKETGDWRPTITPAVFENAEEQVLSHEQRRLWFLESYEGGSNAYNIPMVWEIAEGVDEESLKDSIKEIVRRHEVLHSVVKAGINGEAYQETIETEEQPFEIGIEYADDSQSLRDKIKTEINWLFKLDKEYPIRTKLYETDNVKYVSIVVHHIAFDGWSLEVFFRELISLYDYFAGGRKEPYPLEELKLQYKDYAVWQRGYLKGDILEQRIRYWTDILGGYETLNLMTDKARPLYMNYEGADIAFEFDGETSKRIKEAAKDMGVSVYTLLLSAYYFLLSTYSNQTDITLGTVMANRQYPELSGLIGFFANTLALRYEVDSEQDIDVFVRSIGAMVEDAQKYQDVPFDVLVDRLGIERDPSRSPIFQAVFTLQDLRYDKKALNSLFKETRGIGNEFTVAKFDLTLTIEETWDNFRGIFNYAKSLFEQETIESYKETYVEIVYQFIQREGDAK
jgi:acyl carrier protein